MEKDPTFGCKAKWATRQEVTAIRMMRRIVVLMVFHRKYVGLIVEGLTRAPAAT